MPLDDTTGFLTEVKRPSLEGLVAWLEEQNPDTEYDWWSVSGCLACQYLKAVEGTCQKTCYADIFPSGQIYGEVCAMRPWTFGAALTRARAALEGR